jgi:hypothetical protein
VSEIPDILYFGCHERAGHFIWGRYGQVREFDRERWKYPSAASLDASVIFLPRPEKVGTGALTYLPAADKTILAWWGSPWDTRGNVNAALIAIGRLSADDCWARFEVRLPQIAKHLTKPLVVRQP